MNPNLGFYDLLSIVSSGLITTSYVMRDVMWLRIVSVVASSVGLVVYFNIRPGQPLWVQIFFISVTLTVNLYYLSVLFRERFVTDLADDDVWLYKNTFSFLTPPEFRRLLKIGRRLDLAEGNALLEQGQASKGVAVLTDGLLAVSFNAKPITHISPGGFAGELSFLTGSPASARVQATGTARVFMLDHEPLTQLFARQPGLKAKLEGIWGRILAERLRNLTHKLGTLPEPGAPAWNSL